MVEICPYRIGAKWFSMRTQGKIIVNDDLSVDTIDPQLDHILATWIVHGNAIFVLWINDRSNKLFSKFLFKLGTDGN